MYFLKIIVGVFFIVSSTFAFSSLPQIAVGTFIYHDNIKQPMLIAGDKNNSWSFISTIQNVENGGYLYNVNCTDQTCISTGAIETQRYYWPSNNRRPIFIKSNDYGKSWTVNNNIFNLPSMTDGVAPYISCTGDNCTAVGWYSQKNRLSSSPLILVSKDNGNSWRYVQNITYLPSMKNGSLSAITCEENVCISVGTFNLNIRDDEQLLFLLSKDKGQSWSFVQNIAGLPKMKFASLDAIKCNNNFCIAAGNYATDYVNAHALLLLSQDKGESWTFVKEIPDLENLSAFYIEDLTYSSGSFIAVGGYRKGEGFLQSLILVSNDQGQSWSLIKDISGSKSKKLGWLKSISCADNICVAGGDSFYIGGLYAGMTLLTSQDNGKSWSLTPFVDGLTRTPDIETIKCSETECVAIGNFNDHLGYSHPVLLVSTDKGQSWSVGKDILNFPEDIYEIHFSA